MKKRLEGAEELGGGQLPSLLPSTSPQLGHQRLGNETDAKDIDIFEAFGAC